MLTIAWDVDDVLNNLMQAWLEDFCEQKNIEFEYENIVTNPPHELLGISLAEYHTSLDEFRKSKKALYLNPNPQIIEWMEKNQNKFKHITLSGTSTETAKYGAFWVMKNFSKWINSYNIVPSYRAGENFVRQNETKKDFLQWMNVVDILIEDNQKNYEDAKSLGIKSFLVARPWNKGGQSIEEILKELNKLNDN